MSQERRAFSVAVFARHKGKVLLIAHKRLNTWLPVGGEIKEGETPLEAATRELFEETGLKGSFPKISAIDGTPPGFLGYEEHLAGKKGLHMNFVFVADVDRDTISPNEEFENFLWVSDAEALDCPKNVRQLTKLALSVSEEARTC